MLTNEEKLNARAILRRWSAQVTVPQPEEDAWRRSEVNSDRASAAFETLAWLSFLQKTSGRYEFGADYARFLRGLGFCFQEVVLPARNERFNTNCAPDFFIMTYPPAHEAILERTSRVVDSGGCSEGMSQKMVDAIRGVATSGARTLQESAFYGAEQAILKDACGWSDEPIRVVMDHGRPVEVSPDTTWYLLGGGCGVNNLFRSEEAIRAWLNEHPRFDGRESGPLRRILTKSKARSAITDLSRPNGALCGIRTRRPSNARAPREFSRRWRG